MDDSLWKYPRAPFPDSLKNNAVDFNNIYWFRVLKVAY
jgi:hypothetical protein